MIAAWRVEVLDLDLSRERPDDTGEFAHVAERHRRAGRVLGLHLIIAVWFPYRPLAPARHPQLVQSHCSRGSPHRHLSTHGHCNADKPSLAAPFCSCCHHFSQAGRPCQLSGEPGCAFQFGRMLPSVIGGPGACFCFVIAGRGQLRSFFNRNRIAVLAVYTNLYLARRFANAFVRTDGNN